MRLFVLSSLRVAALTALVVLPPAVAGAQTPPAADPPKRQESVPEAPPGAPAPPALRGDEPPERKPADPPVPRAELPAELSLDELYRRLARAETPEAGTRLQRMIEAKLLASGSDTIDLLMARALAAMAAKQPGVSLDLLDSIIMLRPAYAEAWARRAMVNYSKQDLGRAMGDLEQALALEPRHLSAMTGLAAILEALGEKRKALVVYRRVLDLHPTSEAVRKEVDELAREIEGRAS